MLLSLVVTLVVSQAAPSWKDIDALRDKGEPNAALLATEQRLAAAREAKDDDERARALVRRLALRLSLGALETGASELRAEPLPEAVVPRAIVQVFTALALERYSTGWDVGAREKVATSAALTLKQLTRGQLEAEVEQRWSDLWARRSALGATSLASLREYLTPNDFPPGVRDTLRDFVALHLARWLAAEDHWSAQERNERYRVSRDALLGTGLTVTGSSHPLLRAVAVLDELETWHQRQGQREGALFARVERLQRLSNVLTDDVAKARLRGALQSRLTADAALPLSAWGRVIAARWLRDAGQLVQARDVASVGASAFPDSVGGQDCRALVAELEAPEFNLQARLADGPSRRSVTVSAKNLPRLFFRAYAATADALVGGQHGWGAVPTGTELRALLGGRPVERWTVELPATPDLSLHATQVTPPPLASGAYLLAASAKESFADQDNNIVGVFFVVTKLVLTATQRADGSALEVVVHDGQTGAPVEGVAVRLQSLEYGLRSRVLARASTNRDGFARLTGPHATSAFVLAQKGPDLAFDPGQVEFWGGDAPVAHESALLFTDRAIYRPGQRLSWKVVAYQAPAGVHDLRVLPKANVRVRLLDANGEQVAVRSVTTNDFGSASGEFAIPVGRLLGAWSLEAKEAVVGVRVEEYKRPTYEVTFADTGAALKLNAPARLHGEARYYFGLPVTAGKVTWRVQREPLYPWWLRRWAPPARRQLVASGVTTLAADGGFDLDFVPSADPATSREVSWSYTAEADVTEDGGETRSASRTVRLGVVSVQASFEVEHGFFRANEAATVKVRRTSLDGDGRAGAGTWRLMALAQPSAPVLWADEPVDHAPFEAARALVTPGDALRPRSNTEVDVAATLRRWAEAGQVAAGAVTHAATGEGLVSLPGLAAGAYRLHYQTADEAGAPLEMATELVVASDTFPLAVPAWLSAQTHVSEVGSTARFLLGSGFAGQSMLLEVLHGGAVLERRWVTAGKEPAVFERRSTLADRGGFAVRLTVVRDWQVATFTEEVNVPWTDKALTVGFATMRDSLRPGSTERFTVTVRGASGPLPARSVELLASMYDKALDAFVPFAPMRLDSLYPQESSALMFSSSVSVASGERLSRERWYELPPAPEFVDDRVESLFEGFSGFGERTRVLQQKRYNTIQVIRGSSNKEPEPAKSSVAGGRVMADAVEPPEPNAAPALRGNFAETALFAPHLLLGEDGEVRFEVPVPDSVTAWNLWVSALTKDLRGGFADVTLHSVKELMVRPALPRFLREGDRAALKIVVNNASAQDLSGQARLELFDPATNRSLLAEFGVADASLPWSAKAGQSVTLTVPLEAPRRVGEVGVKVVASAGERSDGEVRSIPLLPSRVRLTQSRFVALKDADSRTLDFRALTSVPDPTRIDEQLVVTVDAQLFTSVLSALPSLVRSPYECTEQTLNRFLSTSIVASVFRDTPAVATLAAQLAKRPTPYEPFDALDPNRKAAFEETPWLSESKGGDDELGAVSLLEPAALNAERTSALRKLRAMQLESGGFPWFPGGEASPAMTLYLVQGLARAAEFKVEVPRPMVARAWQYVVTHTRAEFTHCLAKEPCDLPLLTSLVHAASAFPDASWLGGTLAEPERQALLQYSFQHWREQSSYLRGLLALALKRSHREADAKLVFDSVMATATTTPDEGTFWQPEDRAWLWYHDTVEGHAFALRALSELSPADPRRDGLAQWLLLNKKLNHWKSTRATAEAIYALVTYQRAEQSLGVRQTATVTVGPVTRELVFDPKAASARTQRVVVTGNELDPKTMSTVTVASRARGFQFASATWHFSTERLPEKPEGDLFGVTRTYFKRVQQGSEVTLLPLREGARLEPGDELEVQLAIRAKQAAEYVHLRDPRGAGFEPSVGLSRYRYDLGLGWYEEVRDSATNFFFERVPAGAYTLTYRVRASMGGTFRVGPATLQSMYAPEFAAYSAGQVLTVGAGGR